MFAARSLFFALAALASAPALAAGPYQYEYYRKWSPGWDNFGEPLNVFSGVTFDVNPFARTLTIKSFFVHAQPSKSYQLALHFFCSSFAANFGQFANDLAGGGACAPLTRQGVTKDIAAVEIGALTTDAFGNGALEIQIGPIASGTYSFELVARNGTGCNLLGGGSGGPVCGADFQSPGPSFGDGLTISMP